MGMWDDALAALQSSGLPLSGVIGTYAGDVGKAYGAGTALNQQALQIPWRNPLTAAGAQQDLSKAELYGLGTAGQLFSPLTGTSAALERVGPGLGSAFDAASAVLDPETLLGRFGETAAQAARSAHFGSLAPDTTALAMAGAGGIRRGGRGRGMINAIDPSGTPTIVTPADVPPDPGAVLRMSLPSPGETPITVTSRAGPAAATTPAQRGILATPDLRQMSLSDAMDTAASEPHLIQDKTGQYVGAPRGMTTREQLQAMRDKFDADVALGAPGGDWYTRAAGENAIWAGPDPARQRLLAQEQAFWSPQAAPDPNLGWVFQAHNAYEMGQPLDLVHTGRQAQVYQNVRAAAEGGNREVAANIPMGPKTDIYGVNLDPTRPPSTTGTNDIWHARGFGYNNPDGSLFDRALTDQEHRFLDYETVLATKRANDLGLAGRTNWTAPQIQAAAWVAGKGRALAERGGTSLEEGIAKASKTYPDYAPKYGAFGTYEQTPALGINHLPDLLTGSPADRAAFAATNPWIDPATGRDVIYDRLGIYQRPTVPATGIYTPPGGGLETNPASVARPFVGMTADTRVVDPASRLALDVGEGGRAYVDAQGAGAWHKIITDAKAGEMGSLHVPLPGPLPPDKVAALQELGAKYGVPDVADSGRGVTLTNFGGTTSGKDMGAYLKKGDLRSEISNLLGSDAGEPVRVKVDSNLIPMFHGDWPGGNLPAAGSGQVTRRFLDLVNQLTPSARLKLGEGLQGGAAANLERDAQLGERGQMVRPDIQTARRLLSQPGGIDLLARAHAAGVPLPAIVGGGLGLGALSLRPWGSLYASPDQQQGGLLGG